MRCVGQSIAIGSIYVKKISCEVVFALTLSSTY